MNRRVFIVKRACPLCGGDVKGNDDLGYYCKRCNLIFSFDELRKNSKIILDEKKHVQQEQREQKEPQELKETSHQTQGLDKQVSGSSDLKCEPKEEVFFVASKMSNKFHTPNCPFAKNILPENRIIFESKEEALSHGFKPCRCVD